MFIAKPLGRILFFCAEKMDNLLQVDMYVKACRENFYETEDSPQFFQSGTEKKPQQKAGLKNSDTSVCH